MHNLRLNSPFEPNVNRLSRSPDGKLQEWNCDWNCCQNPKTVMRCTWKTILFFQFFQFQVFLVTVGLIHDGLVVTQLEMWYQVIIQRHWLALPGKVEEGISVFKNNQTYMRRCVSFNLEIMSSHIAEWKHTIWKHTIFFLAFVCMMRYFEPEAHFLMFLNICDIWHSREMLHTTKSGVPVVLRERVHISVAMTNITRHWDVSKKT